MSIFAKPNEGGGDSADYTHKEVSSIRTRNGSDHSGEISIIGKGVRIRGDLHVVGDVRVAGRIDGEVNVESRIVVAPEGVIHGCIHSGEGDIAGQVEGDITTKGRVVVRKTASILGKIVAANLVVEEGAALRGSFSIGKPAKVQTEAGRKQAASAEPSGAPAPAAVLPLK